jgi:hypothetical protein
MDILAGLPKTKEGYQYILLVTELVMVVKGHYGLVYSF